MNQLRLQTIGGVIAVVVGVLVVGAGLGAGLSGRARASQPVTGVLNIPAGPEARLAKAKRVYELLGAGQDGAPLSRHAVEQSYLWSWRWMQAQNDADAARAGERSGVTTSRAAASAHLERMRAVAAKITEMHRLGEIAEFDVACTQYYVVEAEELATRAGAE